MREQDDEIGFSAGAKRRFLSQRVITCCTQFEDAIYIYMYPELRIDNCRFRLRRYEGARGSIEGAEFRGRWGVAFRASIEVSSCIQPGYTSL